VRRNEACYCELRRIPLLETVWKVLTSPKNRPYETARGDEEAPCRWLLATNTCTWDAL